VVQGDLMERTIVVRFQREGFHCWPDAPASRGYLRDKHRHLFHVEVTLEVGHNDREVELHDLKDWCERTFPEGDYGEWSCEDLAEDLLTKVLNFWGPWRWAQVSVLEDGENGAVVAKC